LLLGKRHFYTFAFAPPDHFQALAHLDYHVREPADRGTLSDIDAPFPESGGID